MMSLFEHKTNLQSVTSDSYSVKSLMEVSSSVVTRKYVPGWLFQNQPCTRPSLKPVSRSFVSPPTDVE